MNTQLEQVKSEIRTLEVQLKHATLYNDAFSKLQLNKELEAKKSFKSILEWM